MKHNFLICMNSFRRPIEAIGQIRRFFDMNCNFDMCVTFRGICPIMWNTIIDDLQKQLSTGRLYIQYKENTTNYFNNLMDCVSLNDKNRNGKTYDYYFKIDDDDIYNMNYVNYIDNFLTDDMCGCRCSNNAMYIVKNDNNYVKCFDYYGDICGGALVWNNYVCDILRKIYTTQNPKRILDENKMSDIYTRAFDFGKCEDRLIDHIMKSLEKSGVYKYGLIEHDKLYYWCHLTQGVLHK